MVILLWVLIGFFTGAIPFSLIIGKLVSKTDIRAIGDGNPGGANVIKAGGLKAGIPAILLDTLKGFFPIYLAQKYGLAGWALVPICMAPILGHAFSPFLRFRGGKALATTGGVWVAIVGLWAYPLYGSVAGLLALIQSEDAWSGVGGMLPTVAYTIFIGEPWLVIFSVLNCTLLCWTHRHALVRPPKLRPWLRNILWRSPA